MRKPTLFEILNLILTVAMLAVAIATLSATAGSTTDPAVHHEINQQP